MLRRWLELQHEVGSIMPESNQRLVFQWTATKIRFVAASIVGCVAFVLAFALEIDTRILLAYDLAIATYLAFLIVRMSCADGAETGELAAKKETSNKAVLTLAAILSACSLAGVG